MRCCSAIWIAMVFPVFAEPSYQGVWGRMERWWYMYTTTDTGYLSRTLERDAREGRGLLCAQRGLDIIGRAQTSIQVCDSIQVLSEVNSAKHLLLYYSTLVRKELLEYPTQQTRRQSGHLYRVKYAPR